ncbi:unnamed protein product [Rotaria sordida]|uniref:MULE transposase domain-containing protein n=1 Tax=Rotaria sordida TaxID=392033 RepID=A0A814Q0L9_9BILA|nr:unnamed protein product [Rotaria sordida]
MACTTDQIGKENIKVTFVKSNKGQLLLSLNGYLYKCNKGKENKKYCGGIEAHDHEPNPDMIAARIVRNKIKERAVQENLPLSMIYEQEVSNSSINSTTTAILPTCQEFGPTLGKVRAKVMPVLPQDCLFDIPDQFKTTLDGNRFLLMDDSIIRREQCKKSVHTDANDIYFCGGTEPHDHEPNPDMIAARNVRNKIKERALQEMTPISMIYEQEISNSSINSTTIAILPTCQELGPTVTKVRAKAVPLLPQSFLFDIPDEFKTTLAGQRFLLMDDSIARCERILVIMTDFETGILPVIKSEFPSAQHHACFFHFTQSVFRQIQRFGMQCDYVSKEDFRILCRKLMALALMPPDQVVLGFEEVRAAAGQLDGGQMEILLTYFENNWLSNIDLWNVSRCETRTNNVCEGEDIK